MDFTLQKEDMGKYVYDKFLKNSFSYTVSI